MSGQFAKDEFNSGSPLVSQILKNGEKLNI